MSAAYLCGYVAFSSRARMGIVPSAFTLVYVACQPGTETGIETETGIAMTVIGKIETKRGRVGSLVQWPTNLVVLRGDPGQ